MAKFIIGGFYKLISWDFRVVFEQIVVQNEYKKIAIQLPKPTFFLQNGTTIGIFQVLSLHFSTGITIQGCMFLPHSL